MALVSDLDRVLARFEDKRQARCRKAAVLKQKRDNVLVYLELLAIPPTQLNTNAAKRRAQHILFLIKDYSLELFVLYALTTNQRTLTRVKWTRDKVPYESIKLDNIELLLDLIERAARYSSQATFIIKQI